MAFSRQVGICRGKKVSALGNATKERAPPHGDPTNAARGVCGDWARRSCLLLGEKGDRCPRGPRNELAEFWGMGVAVVEGYPRGTGTMGSQSLCSEATP